MLRRLIALFWVALLTSLAAAAPEKPRRRPDDSGYLEVDLRVPLSRVDILGGPGARYRGTLWFVRKPGRKYEGGADLAVRRADGSSKALDAVSFATDAESDPLGEPATLAALPRSDRILRLLSTSDLALLPLRAVLRHEIDFPPRRREAVKERSLPGAIVRMWEKNLGLGRVGGVTVDRRVTRMERHLLPSGHLLIDVCLTCEDPDENLVLWGRGVRLLLAPRREVGTEDPLASGILLHVDYTLCQLDWSARATPIPDRERYVREAEWPGLEERFFAEFGNVLLSALPDEGLGDPFDAPMAYLLRESDLLDEAFVKRLARVDDRRALPAAAPALLAAKVPLDPSDLARRLGLIEDPFVRLLMDGLCGRSSPRLRRAAVAEVTLASRSRDPRILEAARAAAAALGDRGLLKRLQRTSSGD